MSINLVVEILSIIITTIWEGIKIIFKLISPFFKNIPTSLLDFIKKDLSKNAIFFDNVFITKIIIFVISLISSFVIRFIMSKLAVPKKFKEPLTILFFLTLVFLFEKILLWIILFMVFSCFILIILSIYKKKIIIKCNCYNNEK